VVSFFFFFFFILFLFLFLLPLPFGFLCALFLFSVTSVVSFCFCFCRSAFLSVLCVSAVKAVRLSALQPKPHPPAGQEISYFNSFDASISAE
jgi:hypothetical protein